MGTHVAEQGVHTSVTVVIFLQWLFTEAHQYARKHARMQETVIQWDLCVYVFRGHHFVLTNGGRVAPP